MVGPIWRRRTGEGVECGILADDRHGNHRAIVHGGLVMAFADMALGLAVADAVGDQHLVTVQLDVHFVSATAFGQLLIGRGRLVRKTSSLYFADGQVEAAGQPIASAQGIWKVVRPETP